MEFGIQVAASVIGSAVVDLMFGKGKRWVKFVWLIPLLVLFWTNGATRPTGVSIDCSETTLTAGKELTIKATVMPLNAAQQVTWRSSAPHIAQVSSDGVVLARAGGTATITVETVINGHKAECNIIVKQSPAQPSVPTGLTLDKSQIELVVGSEQILRANVSPANASDRRVTWRSSAPHIAQVSSDGVVLARAAGTVTITAETVINGHKAECTVAVKQSLPPPTVPTGVSIDRTRIELNVGSSAILTATVGPVNASDQRVTWTSNAPHVAQVSPAGVVSAGSVGTAWITATTISGEKASCEVVVGQSGSPSVARIGDYHLTLWTSRGEDVVTLTLYLDNYSSHSRYFLQYKKTSEAWNQAQSSNEIETGSDRVYFGIYSGLMQGNTYDFRVGIEGVGGYTYSEPKSITIPLNDIQAPTNVRVKSIGSTSITLTWDPVPKATSYIPHWHTPETNLGIYTSDTHFRMDNLQPDTEYEICVAATYSPHVGIDIRRESERITVRTAP